MKIAVFGNDATALCGLEKKLIELSEVVEVMAYSDYGVAEAVISEPQFEIAIIWLKWDKGKSGLALGESLYRSNRRIKTVFVFESADRDVEGVFLGKTNVCGLLKDPIDAVVLEALIYKLGSEVRNESAHYLTVKRYGAMIRLNEEDIYFIESSGHSVIIHTKAGEERIYSTLADIEGKLSSVFLRCQRSFLVNARKISKIDHRGMVLDNGKKLPIGRGYQKKIVEDWHTYSNMT